MNVGKYTQHVTTAFICLLVCACVCVFPKILTPVGKTEASTHQPYLLNKIISTFIATGTWHSQSGYNFSFQLKFIFILSKKGHVIYLTLKKVARHLNIFISSCFTRFFFFNKLFAFHIFPTNKLLLVKVHTTKIKYFRKMLSFTFIFRYIYTYLNNINENIKKSHKQKYILFKIRKASNNLDT